MTAAATFAHAPCPYRRAETIHGVPMDMCGAIGSERVGDMPCEYCRDRKAAEDLHPSGGGAAESVGAKRARAVAATPSAASGTACVTAKSAHIGAGDRMRGTPRRSPSGTPRPSAAPKRADTSMTCTTKREEGRAAKDANDAAVWPPTEPDPLAADLDAADLDRRFCSVRQAEVKLDERRCDEGRALIKAENARAMRAEKRRKALTRNDWSDVAAIYGVRIDAASMKTYNRGVIPGGCRTAAHRRPNA